MTSVQYVVGLYWQYFLVLLCCYVVPLHFTYSTLPWYSHCSASILCSEVLPVFRCSAGVPCAVVPCSGVPGFIACRLKLDIFSLSCHFTCDNIPPVIKLTLPTHSVKNWRCSISRVILGLLKSVLCLNTV